MLFANRAAAYRKLNKNVDALHDCNKAIELNENYTKAYIRRAEIKKDMGEYDEAMYDYEKVRQLDPSTPNI